MRSSSFRKAVFSPGVPARGGLARRLPVLEGVILGAAALTAFPMGAALADSAVTTTVSLVSAQGVGQGVGSVVATQSPDGLVLTPHLFGLPPGVHGFHLHANPSCLAEGKDGKTGAALAAGGHFDPANTGSHQGPLGAGHKGDLPPLLVSASGVADHPVVVPHLTLDDIAGHALVIHAGGDNFADTPDPLGGGGGRIACGVVGR